jgi:hypothetical protein
MSAVEQKVVNQDVTVGLEQKVVNQDVKTYIVNYGLKYLLERLSYLDSTRGLAYND